MWDCFGYGAGCEICNTSIASCEEVHLLNGDLLCQECKKAVKDAREQALYLKRLNVKRTDQESTNSGTDTNRESKKTS